MITAEDLQNLRVQVAALQSRAQADEQTLVILQANLTLAIDKNSAHVAELDNLVKRGKEAVAAAKAAVADLTEIQRVSRDVIADARVEGVRLQELMTTNKDTLHRLASLRSAINATMDYLDRVDPTPAPPKGTA